ncbi:MAG: ribosomal RNA small subunit methyltransferase A [Armatimonadetes bacterium]|nr:ribosomal RNA small subunit methyltransferase A [Candidatus Hippobium faecium]
MNLTSVKDVKELLFGLGLHPKHGLGQNFLIDNNTVENITRAVSESSVYGLEIGSGLGVLTSRMGFMEELICVETDRDMIKCLNVTTEGMDNISLINKDFMDVDLSEILSSHKKYVAFGNLPYYITTPIIIKLLENRKYFRSIVMMVQKEVADRMKASPGGKDYGALSVLVQFYGKPELICNVSRNCFYPVPNVNSAVIKIELYDNNLFDVDEKLYFDVVRAAFGKRRKTLLNSLSNSQFLDYSKEEILSALEKSGIDSGVRGETLSLEEFAKISKNISLL